MNEVWLVMPSANIEMAKKTFPEWKLRGYKIAIICPDDLYNNYLPITDMIIKESKHFGYSGWAKSVNILCNELKDIDITIAAGDDMYPDNNYVAEELRQQFINYFNGTFGIMQPIGDKFGSMACPECEQICGSAWLGKDFRNKINKGNGPMWDQYWHMYADTELYQIGIKYNCLWLREDLNQYHEHRLRGKHNFKPTIPRGNTDIAKKIYFERKENNFPNTEPI